LRSGSSRRQPRPAAWSGIALLCAASLAGCGTVESLNPFASASNAPPPPAACPLAVILQPLKQTAVFAPGAEHQPLGVAFYGILDEVRSRCEREGDTVRASLDIDVIGERGPSARGGTGVDLQYFVAVTGPNQTILSKRSFPVHVAIPANVKRAGITDHIVETIPLAGQRPGDLSLVLGFQQSPEVVDFYRHFRGR